ncbi:MAG: alpha/beta hydrolase, partial [Planctomycetaceae bacterium]|nr:alpha/beta hydrolase [Planctomycetaceae bacterium]
FVFICLLNVAFRKIPAQEDPDKNLDSIDRTPSVDQTKASNLSPDGSVIFGQIEIAEDQCMWNAIEKPFKVVAPIRGLSGRDWRFGGPPLSTPKDRYLLGSHQRYPLDKKGDPIKSTGSVDPVFNITLLNKSQTSVVLSRIGIRPIAAWTSPKGPPFAGKVTQVDCYCLNVKTFEVDGDQWLRLKEPVYLESHAPYRIQLMLKGYCDAVRRNETVIQFLIETNLTVIASDETYLGKYSI